MYLLGTELLQEDREREEKTLPRIILIWRIKWNLSLIWWKGKKTLGKKKEHGNKPKNCLLKYLK